MAYVCNLLSLIYDRSGKVCPLIFPYYLSQNCSVIMGGNFPYQKIYKKMNKRERKKEKKNKDRDSSFTAKSENYDKQNNPVLCDITFVVHPQGG